MPNPKPNLDFFQASLDFIQERRWNSIKSEWIRYIPTSETSIDAFESDFSSDTSFIEEVKKLKKHVGRNAGDKSAICFQHELPLIRTSLFSDGIYNLLKAINLISCAERSSAVGYPTCALSTAYQANAFASRSLLAFLGIAYREIDSRTIVVDIWPQLGKRGSQGKIVDWEPTINIIYAGDRFNHQKHWSLFIHVFRRIRESGWPDDYSRVFRTLKSHSDYSAQRNQLHYQNGWIFDDLRTSQIEDAIGVVLDPNKFTNSSKDSTLKLGQIFIAVVYNAVISISKNTATLDNKIQQIKSLISEERHPKIYNGCLESTFR